MAIIAFFFVFAFSDSAFALTKVTASIDSNPVMSNESIVLTVTADDSIEREALDTSPLATNFIIARTEVSSQTSMVNFKTSRTTRWQIVLIPRKTGKLIIPALNIENSYSDPIAVVVVEQGKSSSTKQQDIFISAELSSNDVYVQQLVTLTVKLHISVQLQRGSLTEPSLTGASIIQVGKDQESDNIINGKRYRIIERTYAITPEQSGELTLMSPMFAGEVMVQSKRRSGFLSFGETKPVNILGEKLALNVRPIPDSYPSNASWLPSELLTLHQEWQPNSNEFKVGEPITRTITLTAAGLAKAQLPKIDMQAPLGMKVYPDQAETHSNLSTERLVSQKKQNFALVASQPGQYTLPKITINWWNTVTNKYQQAVLPEQTITIAPNPDGNQIRPNTTIESNQPTLSSPDNTVTDVTPIIIEKSPTLQWIFLALWLITLIAWISHVIYLKRSDSPKVNVDVQNRVNNHYLALMAACKQSDPEKVLSLIVPWINSLQTSNESSISTLTEAQLFVDNESFNSAIHHIQQFLYGRSTDESIWDSNKLLTVIQEINSASKRKTNKTSFTINPS